MKESKLLYKVSGHHDSQRAKSSASAACRLEADQAAKAIDPGEARLKNSSAISPVS